MIDCPCGFGKNIKEEQTNCDICGTDLTPLHRLSALSTQYYNEGVKLFEQNLLDQAIEKLLTAVTLGMNSAAPFAVLGTIYSKKGFYDEAVNYFQKSLAIDPENEEVKGDMRKANYFRTEAENKELKQ